MWSYFTVILSLGLLLWTVATSDELPRKFQFIIIGLMTLILIILFFL